MKSLLAGVPAIWSILCGPFAMEPVSASDQLTALIVREQTRDVKRSTGVYAYNCSTSDDLIHFHQSGRVSQNRRRTKDGRTNARVRGRIS
jgi:hypothetical protein